MASGEVSVGGAYGRAFEIFKEQAVSVLVVTMGPQLLIAAVSIGIMVVGIAGSMMLLGADGGLIAILAQLVAVVVQLFLMAWLLPTGFAQCIALADGRQISFRDFFKPHPRTLAFIGASILFTIAVSIGMVLLVIPGIFLALALQPAMLHALESRAGVIGVLQESFAMTAGHRGTIFLFGLAAFGLNLAGSLALGVGVLVTAPVTMIAWAVLYRQLAGGGARGAGSSPLHRAAG